MNLMGGREAKYHLVGVALSSRGPEMVRIPDGKAVDWPLSSNSFSHPLL